MVHGPVVLVTVTTLIFVAVDVSVVLLLTIVFVLVDVLVVVTKGQEKEKLVVVLRTVLTLEVSEMIVAKVLVVCVTRDSVTVEISGLVTLMVVVVVLVTLVEVLTVAVMVVETNMVVDVVMKPVSVSCVTAVVSVGAETNVVDSASAGSVKVIEMVVGSVVVTVTVYGSWASVGDCWQTPGRTRKQGSTCDVHADTSSATQNPGMAKAVSIHTMLVVMLSGAQFAMSMEHIAEMVYGSGEGTVLPMTSQKNVF